MLKLDLEKAEEPEIKWPISIGSLKKAREFQKNIYFCLLTTPKPLTVWIPTNWEILKEMGIPDHLTCLLRNLYASQEATVRTMDCFQNGNNNMEQWTGSKMGKEYVKTVYCHPDYLIYMQSTSCEMPGWMKHRLESRLPGEISIASKMQMTPLMPESEEELKSLLMKVKEESEKAGWKLKKLRLWHPVPSFHGKKMGKQWK